jgi:hypothetical protein
MVSIPNEVQVDVAIVEKLETVIGERGTQDVAAQPFPAWFVVAGDASCAL